ncbi:MAG: Galactoside O-acetyltransferase [Chlamydiae bacterium]|nr:Galactoside O-acetyltransferase [Chlamydiota bacterium]
MSKQYENLSESLSNLPFKERSVKGGLFNSKYLRNNLFLTYSYFSTLANGLLDVLPHFVRNVFFKLFLGRLGKDCLIDYKVYMRYFKRISIGSNSAINRGCEFYPSHHLKKNIIIGNNVVISPNVKFFAASQDYKESNMPDIGEDIIVEDNCYICAGSILLQGVKIGQNSVVGAGSVVTRSIPPNSVAVGVPCRVIKTRKTT